MISVTLPCSTTGIHCLYTFLICCICKYPHTNFGIWY